MNLLTTIAKNHQKVALENVTLSAAFVLIVLPYYGQIVSKVPLHFYVYFSSILCLSACVMFLIHYELPGNPEK